MTPICRGVAAFTMTLLVSAGGCQRQSVIILDTKYSWNVQDGCKVDFIIRNNTKQELASTVDISIAVWAGKTAEGRDGFPQEVEKRSISLVLHPREQRPVTETFKRACDSVIVSPKLEGGST